MTNEFTTAYEPIDLCACFDMIFDPPAEVVREWEKEWNERFMANKERGYYGTELDGTLYYYNGNTRTKVTEFFAAGRYNDGQADRECCPLCRRRKRVRRNLDELLTESN